MRHDPYVYLYERPEVDAAQTWHGVFALRLLSCPAERDDGREGGAAAARLRVQVDLINALFCPEPRRAFAVRFLTYPHPQVFSAGHVDVALLSRVVGSTKREAQTRANALCREVLALLGGAMPDYAWSLVTERAVFDALWQPFDWSQAHMAEIRRREDQVRLETVRPHPALGRGRPQPPPPWRPEEAVYFVHHFLPRPTTLGRLLRTMLLHHAPVLVNVTLTPVWLTDEEEDGLIGEVAKCEQYVQRSDALGRESLVLPQTIHERRATSMCEGLLDQLLRLQDAPFLLTVTLASPEPLPRTLVEAAGVEITAPVGDEASAAAARATVYMQMGGYDVVVPGSEAERRLAWENAQHLEHRLWGASLAPPALRRVRYLTDAREAAGAFRFPVATVDGLLGVDVHTARQRPLPRDVAALEQDAKPPACLLLGENRYLGIPQPVHMLARDRRQHVYVVGQTGTGKTTLLRTMILADMAAGNGLAVIDPHGDLFQDLLYYLPKARWADVVLLDPTDMEFPVGLNLLECADEHTRHFVVRELRAIMERLIEDQYQYKAAEYAGPVFYQHMQMNMLLAMSNPHDPGTLLEFYEIFQQRHYWKRWRPLRWHDPQLERWMRQSLPNIDYTKRGSENATWGEYLSSKFDDFVFDPMLRLIFGQKRSTIDLRQIMDSGKILLVNLAKGELAEANARFLGMVLMAKILAAAMARVDQPVHQRRVFYLYVDEFQSLATQSFVTLLSEARKFGLGLVLANQFVSQIKDERIVQSIFGNVGTLISFRVGRADAELLAPQFTPLFDFYDLANLPNWQACMKTTVGGQVVPPFTLHTLAPADQPDPTTAHNVRQRSRRAYGRPRAQVEAEIARSLGLAAEDEEEE
jgi:hypothetical protein